MKIAVMQPYFVPYAGYFRLFDAVDMFVAFDCVQFPRRGWVHRNRLMDISGALQWLTLPLKKGNRDTTRICDLEFPENASLYLDAYKNRFPALTRLTERYPELVEKIFSPIGNPIDYLIANLYDISMILGMQCPIIRSSSLGIPAELKAQDRIIAIAQKLGASAYVNPPGGRELYDGSVFRGAGLSLHFLSSYEGGYASILERLATDDIGDLVSEIQRNRIIDPPL